MNEDIKAIAERKVAEALHAEKIRVARASIEIANANRAKVNEDLNRSMDSFARTAFNKQPAFQRQESPQEKPAPMTSTTVELGSANSIRPVTQPAAAMPFDYGSPPDPSLYYGLAWVPGTGVTFVEVEDCDTP